MGKKGRKGLQTNPGILKTAHLASPHTPYGRVRLVRFARVTLLRHVLPISLLILRKKPTVLQSSEIPFAWFGLHTQSVPNHKLMDSTEIN